MSEPPPAAALSAALAHHQAGRLAEAEAGYRALLEREPGVVAALHYLGTIVFGRGHYTEAFELFQRAVEFAPHEGTLWANLAETCRQLGRLEAAITHFRQALALDPTNAIAWSNLGNALTSLGQFDAAQAAFERALQLRPDYANAHNNLGQLFTARRDYPRAIACYERAVAANPRFPEALNNWGNALVSLGKFDEAPAFFERALTLAPQFSDAHGNLAAVRLLRGEVASALRLYKQALALEQDRADIHSNVVFALHYVSGDDAGSIEAELARWDALHGQPRAAMLAPVAADRAAGRPLRIGWVSRDFRRHPVAFFLLPLLEALDRTQFHVTCYSANAAEDSVTARFRAAADKWRSLVGLNDEQAAALIRADRIDILVDLSGHTAGNRLTLFALRPAPLQVSYLGFPGDTGLTAIDYHLSDAWADPLPAADVPKSTGRVWRLPVTAWCFSPLSGSPPIAPLPAASCGCITFGCFNNHAKVTDAMLDTWAEILRRVPTARLAMKNLALGNASVAQRLRAALAARGVAAERLEFLPAKPEPLDHLRCYDGVDLALDTFPYHGTTTTCEALWMGVPVVTLAGTLHVARVGVSLLHNAGLPEFIAPNRERYIEIAVAAAQAPERLAALRAGLRVQMQASRLMDATAFARDMEQAWRRMWRESTPTVER